ncbi:MAG: BatD family protein, partial [Polyangiaceae bacterium]
MSRAVAAVVMAAALAGCAAEAHAAPGQPDVQLGVDADTVGVGDSVRLEMSVTSTESMPSDPQIGATPGFALRGQSSSPSQTHMSINGQVSDRYTLTVDWTLRATRTGSFAVGPPTVMVGSTRYATRAVTLHVVPAGQAPPRAAPQQQQQQPFGFPFQFSPFDPWRNFFQPPGSAGSQPQQPAQPDVPPTDPKLALDAPRGQLYFLHATVDKTSAVVGEPVLLTVYAYIDISSPNLEIDDSEVHDPDVADFAKRSLMKDDETTSRGYASIGGKTWTVLMLRRWALFPLRAGDLTIGPMSMALARPRSVAGTKRASETIHVSVSEPPLAGRPPGYSVGDVGHFTLSAQVQPRQTEQGGAIGVHVDVSGKGNVPNAIAVPSRPGVEWLTPQVHEQLGPIGKDAYGGTRSFDYVVRLTRTGDVDLGDLSLPFWDPDARRYVVASAKLGTVNVAPTPAAQTTTPD